jgi:hypothetical protein
MYPPGAGLSYSRHLSSRRWSWNGSARADGAGVELLQPDEQTSILVADATLAGGPLALDQALSMLSESTLIPKHHTVSAAGDRTLHLFAASAEVEECRDAFMLDPTVVAANHVATFPDGLMFQLDLTDDAVLVAPTSLELGARTLSVRGHDGQWNARVQFPDRDALVALRQFCQEHDIEFGIDSLYHTDWGRGTTTNLTEQQREALLMAFERGYYDVPREITQDNLATALDISRSAVSHRLRRATAQLIEESFDNLDT